MTEVRVNWAAEHFAIVLSEKLSFIGELDNLSWADKSEVERIEEEKPIFVFEILAADILETLSAGIPGIDFEEGSNFADSSPDNLWSHVDMYIIMGDS